jgi:hypothetical protein
MIHVVFPDGANIKALSKAAWREAEKDLENKVVVDSPYGFFVNFYVFLIP